MTQTIDAKSRRPRPRGVKGFFREMDEIARRIEAVLERIDASHNRVQQMREHGRHQQEALDAAIRSMRERR